MRVLVACEFTGTVRDAFRERGHEAWSCDLLESENSQIFHWQLPIQTILGLKRTSWDLMIAHPPCTYLNVAGAWAFGDGPYHQNVKPGTLVGKARREARAQAFEFFMELWNVRIPHICIENPIGVMSTLWRKPDQIIQPYQFGHDASKATCLWLKGLPKLKPTNYVEPRMVGGRPRWANQTDSGQNRLSPSLSRAMDRARTYQNIAKAMAKQWGGSNS